MSSSGVVEDDVVSVSFPCIRNCTLYVFTHKVLVRKVTSQIFTYTYLQFTFFKSSILRLVFDSARAFYNIEKIFEFQHLSIIEKNTIPTKKYTVIDFCQLSIIVGKPKTQFDNGSSLVIRYYSCKIS